MKNEIYKNKEWLNNRYSIDKVGTTTIAKECGVDDATILYYLKKYSIPIRSRTESNKISSSKKIYVINESYFENIDNSRKAYWLGFLMADGTMREHIPGCYQLSFELNEKDLYIIEQFNADIDSTYRITITNNVNTNFKRARLIITNYNFCVRLVKYGIIPHKTGHEKMPSIDSKFYKDFIRGFFDGDGYIMFKQSNRVRGKFHIVSCSYDILKDIMNILPVDFSEKSLHLKSGTNHIYELETANLVNLAKIYDYLYYDNCICLKRKEDIFKTFLKYFKKSKRLIKRYSPIH